MIDNTTVAETATLEASDLAAPFEGFRAKAYQDVVGVWTIGYGSTYDAQGNRVGPHTPDVTEPEARQLLATTMKNAASTVARYVHEALTVNMAAALEDFIYNLGSGAFASSGLLHDLNEGNYAAAAAEFDKWDHAGGVELAGLLRRCEARRILFLTP